MTICQYIHLIFVYFIKQWYYDVSPTLLYIHQKPCIYKDNEIGYDIDRESEIVIYRKSWAY
jgi:hypothetical protein